MIKIFRKIRQKLLSENKFSKYLIYAIGEIILVVIGILIALQINNWNEKQKNETKTRLLFSEILQDIENDIKAIDDINLFIDNKDSIAKIILDDEYKIDKTKGFEHDEIRRIFNMYSYFNQSNNGYHNLMEVVEQIPEKYKSTVKYLNSLYNFKNDEAYNAMGIVKNLEVDIKKQLAFNYPWYHDVISNKPNDEAFAFVETSEYKNLLALYMDAYDDYKVRLQVLKMASIVCYAEVHNVVFPNRPKPKFIPTNAIKINNKVLDSYAGVYWNQEGFKFTIERKGEYLVFGEGGILYTTDENGDFVNQDSNTMLIFVKDDTGKVIGVNLDNGKGYVLELKK